MNFDLTDREQAIQNQTATVFDQAARMEVEALEDADLDGIRRTTGRYVRRLAEAGYCGWGVGPEGRSDWVALAAAQEQAASASGSLFLAVEASVRLFGGLLAGWGRTDEASGFLERIQSGRALGAVALSEPGDDQPQDGPRTVIAADGAGYRVDGRKGVVTNAPIADWMAVWGEIDGRPAAVLVAPGTPGLIIGHRLETLGHRGLAAANLTLENVRVPADHLIGPFEDDSARQYLVRTQDLILASAALGVTKNALDEANEYSRTHHRGAKPIYAHQEIRFKLADMFTLYQTAQLLIRRAAWFTARDDREAPSLIGCAKVFAAEAAEKAAGMAMQIVAGRGYLTGNPVERAWREAKYPGIAGTTTEVARMNIADDILGRIGP